MRIISIGEILWDVYEDEEHIGGAPFNFSVNANRLGHKVYFISAVGDDYFGKYILDYINSTNVNTEFIQIIKNKKSGMSVAISDKDGEYGAVVISGVNLHINSEVFNDSAVWEKCKILMIQNEVEDALNIQAAKKAREHGLKICLNASPPQKISSNLITNTDIIIVNLIEAEKISQKKISSIEDAKKIAKEFTKQFELAIITIGEKGVVTCARNNNPFSILAKTLIC